MGNVKELVGDAIRGYWNSPLINPSKVLLDWFRGLFADEQIFCLLGDANAGKTELMCLFKDYEASPLPFFMGTQSHADELGKNAASYIAKFLIGDSLFVVNDGAGAIEVKENRMKGIAKFLGEYLTELSQRMTKSKFEKMHGRLPLYCLFVVNMHSDFDNQVNRLKNQCELRCFKEDVLSNDEIRSMRLKDATEKKESVQMMLDVRFLFIGTHIDRCRDSKESAKRFEDYAYKITDAEFNSQYKVATLVADIRSPSGREAFMTEFKKKMEVLNG